MPHYKDATGKLYFLDDASHADLLPAGCVAITLEEAAALAPQPDTQATIKAQIAALEFKELMPRATREFMLLYLETNGLTAVPGYAPVKAFDNQIAALRAQL